MGKDIYFFIWLQHYVLKRLNSLQWNVFDPFPKNCVYIGAVASVPLISKNTL